MQAHNLTESHGRVHRRVGRGGKRGSFSGKGIKGQKSRSGHRIRPQIREVIKKLHKARGQVRGHVFGALSAKPAVVNLRDLEKHFQNGDKVSAKILLAKGLIKTKGDKMPAVKILGEGKLTKKLSFDKDVLMSESVKNKIK